MRRPGSSSTGQNTTIVVVNNHRPSMDDGATERGRRRSSLDAAAESLPLLAQRPRPSSSRDGRSVSPLSTA